MTEPLIVASSDTNSASQLDTFQDCNRKWAWDKIERIPRDENRFASWGVSAHGMLEGYLKHGTPLDLTTDVGEALMAGLHYFPQPGTPGMTVEGEFLLQGWNHFFYGKKDVQLASRIVGVNVLPGHAPIVESALIDPYHGQLVPVVFDLKTTTSFRYAHTQETLRTNIQAALYATQAMVQLGTQVCDLRWVYVKSRKPWASKPVDLRVTRDDVTPTLTRIKDLADQMAWIKRSGKRALDLAPNPDACEKYGGCSYIDRCNLSPLERMNSIMNAPVDPAKNAFLDDIARMAAQNGGAGAAINPPPPPPPPGLPPSTGFQLPPGGQVSADGKLYWAPGMAEWSPVPAPMPPPAESAGKGKGGRPPGSKNKSKTPETTAAAYQMIADGFQALANLEQSAD